MDNSSQLLELIKHFGDVIKDLNGTFSSLSTSINGLIAQVNNLPKISEIENKLEDIEHSLTRKGCGKLEELASSRGLDEVKTHLTLMLKDVLNKIEKIEEIIALISKFNSGSIDKEKLDVELEKKKLELQQTVVSQSNETERSKIKVYGDIVIKIVAGLVTIAGGFFVVWQLILKNAR